MVTIVIPVYNEIAFIKKTLASIDGQAENIFISDNASTDGTSEICAQFAATRPYVTYERFEKNMGAVNNFNRCIDFPTSKYTFFMGGHDMIEPRYVEDCLSALKETGAVHAYGHSTWINPDYKKTHEYLYWYAEQIQSDNPYVRVAAMCSHLVDCTFFYGLYDSGVLRYINKFDYGSEYIQTDHAMLAKLASIGKSTLQTKSRYLRMQPREPEQDNMKKWARIIQASDSNKEANPLLYPRSIYATQMNILSTLKLVTQEDKKILQDTKQTLHNWWGPFL